MKVVNMHEAKTHLSRLVDNAARGEEVTIARAGKPVAKLVAYRAAIKARKPGAWKGKVWVGPDFDQTDDRIIELFQTGG